MSGQVGAKTLGKTRSSRHGVGQGKMHSRNTEGAFRSTDSVIQLTIPGHQELHPQKKKKTTTSSQQAIRNHCVPFRGGETWAKGKAH